VLTSLRKARAGAPHWRCADLGPGFRLTFAAGQVNKVQLADANMILTVEANLEKRAATASQCTDLLVRKEDA